MINPASSTSSSPPPASPPFRLGIDLGGTKTEIIALDAAGRELLRRRTLTPSGDYAATLDLVIGLVHSAERELRGEGSVGIGMPGAESAVTGAIKNSNSTCLNGRPFRRDIEERLGRHVRIANDANCFALSEAVDGAGAGAHSVFGVILGTGVGGGLVVKGELLVGANAIAGEWGHNPLPLRADGDLPLADLPLPLCYCGRRACVETYLCGPALARDHEAAKAGSLSPAQIAQKAEQGDAACDATLGRYEERLARALAGVINLVDPEVIVLGGGLSNIERLYRNVPKLWTRQVFSDHIATRLVRNCHGDSSGVRGAAWLWGSTTGPQAPPL